MGNQVSSQGEHKELKDKSPRRKFTDDIKANKDDSLFNKDNSSYKGVKTETKTKEADKSVSNDTTGIVSIETQVEVKVPTLFEWKEGGNMVYITGSFSGWTHRFLLTKNNTTGIFEITLDLARAIHEYKFIVDDKWVFSKYQPTCKDNKGNINNTIDTTNYKLPIEKVSETTKKINEEKVTEESKNNTNDDYNEYFPSKAELNVEAPHVPSWYALKFNLDHISHQHLIGNQNFLNYSINNDMSENSSQKQISIFPHVSL